MELCEQLRSALAAAKARLYAAPVRPTFTEDPGRISLSMHLDERDALRAQIDELEIALHQADC